MTKLSLFIFLTTCPIIINCSQEKQNLLKNIEEIYKSGDFSKFRETDKLSEDEQQICKQYIESNHKEVFENIRKSKDKSVSGSDKLFTVISSDGQYVISNSDNDQFSGKGSKLEFAEIQTGEKYSFINQEVGDRSLTGALLISSSWLCNVTINNPKSITSDTTIYITPLQDFNNVKTISIQGFKNSYISPANKYIVVNYFDTHDSKYYISLYDLNNQYELNLKNRKPLKLETNNIVSAMSSDDTIIVYNKKNNIYVRNLKNSKEIELNINGNLENLDISKDSKKLLVRSSEKLLLYELSGLTKKPLIIFDYKKVIKNDLRIAKFSPNNKIIIFNDNSDLYIYSLSKCKAYKQRIDSLVSYDFTPDGNHLIVLTDTNLSFFDLNKFKLSQGSDSYIKNYKNIKCSPNGKSILLYNDDSRSLGNYQLVDISPNCPLQFTLSQTLIIAYMRTNDKKLDENSFKIIKSFNNPEIERHIQLPIILKQCLKQYLITDLINIALSYDM